MISVLAAVLLSAPPSVPQYAMLPLRCQGADEKTCTSLGVAVASELRRYPEVSLLTQDEIGALLSHEQNKMLLGCSTQDCYADLGQAVGAKHLVIGTYNVIGGNQLVALTLLSLKPVAVVGAVSRRIPAVAVAETLDSMPALVAELMLQVGMQARAAAALPKPTKSPIPPGYADLPATVTAIGGEVVLLTDGVGHLVAFDKQKPTETLYGGDAKRLYAQRVIGGGGSPEQYSTTFWEPRVRGGSQRSLERQGTTYTLVCGKKTIALQSVEAGEARKILAGVQLMRPRWRRAAFALARDDQGTYFYVDKVREEEEQAGDETDYRLFIGPKGKAEHLPLEDVIVDYAGAIYRTAKGQLIFGEGGTKAEWVVGETRRKLTPLEPAAEAITIYSKLGAYSGQQLGTVCDPYL